MLLLDHEKKTVQVARTKAKWQKGSELKTQRHEGDGNVALVQGSKGPTMVLRDSLGAALLDHLLD